VRYRFYVNTALLRARKDATVSIRRVSAPEIEQAIETAIRERMGQGGQLAETRSIFDRIERATLKATCIEVRADVSDDARATDVKAFEIPWLANAKPDVSGVELVEAGRPDQKLVQAIVRAHAWLRELTNGKHASIESLAKTVDLNPKVIRQALRLAFLAPGTTVSILLGNQSADLSLRAIPFTLPLSWQDQDMPRGSTYRRNNCEATQRPESALPSKPEIA
jgi:hypothetical protein